MSKIRVLVVDDAVVVRRLVAELLGADAAIEVVGTAANGRAALERIELLEPDLVTLDLEMPEMDGLATLKTLRQRKPRLPVIMLSRFTLRCAAATLEALALGATDYVTLPESGTAAVLRNLLRDQLLPRVLKLGRPRPHKTDPTIIAPFALPQAEPGKVSQLTSRIDVVAIGASTGGPNALATLMPSLPADLPVPVVIVQHMPAGFTAQLASRLSTLGPLRVREAAPGVLLEPGQVWLAPGDFHLTVARTAAGLCLRTNQDMAVNSCRPSVDVLFRSVADACGAGGLAVILTGMGKDGLQGCRALRQAGGAVFAQDEASSVIWGMPGCVVRAALAERVLPLDQLGAEVTRRVRKHRSLSRAESCGAIHMA